MRISQPSFRRIETECLPLRARQQAERAQMGLVHLQSFVGRRGEASREQDPFVLAETGHFSQKPFHALAFFFHLKKGYASGLGESTDRANFRLF
jgi:hypothetical protein